MVRSIQTDWTGLGAIPHRVALVGNAPEMVDQSQRIDTAEWVVRFNNASGFGGVAGSRVTHLTLVNHGGQTAEWLRDPGFINRLVVRRAGSFLFPFARKAPANENFDDNGRDWTDEAHAMLAPLDVPVDVLHEAVHLEAAAILEIDAQRGEAPSTGFLVALHLVRTLPSTVEIDVHGFGFAGWPGHPWHRERAWFEELAKSGRLRLHPIDRPARA